MVLFVERRVKYLTKPHNVIYGWPLILTKNTIFCQGFNLGSKLCNEPKMIMSFVYHLLPQTYFWLLLLNCCLNYYVYWEKLNYLTLVKGMLLNIREGFILFLIFIGKHELSKKTFYHWIKLTTVCFTPIGVGCLAWKFSYQKSANYILDIYGYHIYQYFSGLPTVSRPPLVWKRL
jgi:hypothetical protein